MWDGIWITASVLYDYFFSDQIELLITAFGVLVGMGFAIKRIFT